MKHILLVDDDPLVLASLTTALECRKDVWSVRLAVGPASALEAIAEQTFDAIVCDLQMPRRNGGAVLQAARSTQPGAIRMIMAGPEEMAASVLAMHVAHQFLTKPCPAPLLIQSLERAFRVQDQLGHGDLAPLVCGVTALPSPPRTFQMLSSAMANPEVDLDCVVRLIGAEIAIGTKVLQLANSPVFGLARKVGSLKDAVAYLGLRTLRQLVLGAEVFGGFETARPTCEFDLVEEQDHGVAIARIASEVVAPDERLAEAAFSAALLHDIGAFVLAAQRPETFCRTLAVIDARRRGVRITEEERHLLDLHARVGGYLIGVWGLPDAVVDAVLHHHHPSHAPGPAGLGLPGIVHVADCLFHALAAAGPEQGQCIVERLIDREWLAAAGCADRIEEWLARAAALDVVPRADPTAA